MTTFRHRPHFSSRPAPATKSRHIQIEIPPSARAIALRAVDSGWLASNRGCEDQSEIVDDLRGCAEASVVQDCSRPGKQGLERGITRVMEGAGQTGKRMVSSQRPISESDLPRRAAPSLLDILSPRNLQLLHLRVQRSPLQPQPFRRSARPADNSLALPQHL